MAEWLPGIVAYVGPLSGQVLAYINPGVGALILQGLLMGVAGATYFLKKGTGKLKGIVRRRQPTQESPEVHGQGAEAAEKPISQGAPE